MRGRPYCGFTDPTRNGPRFEGNPMLSFFLSFLRAYVASFFVDSIEVKECHFANGHHVVRVVVAWHGGVRSTAVLQRHIRWRP